MYVCLMYTRTMRCVILTVEYSILDCKRTMRCGLKRGVAGLYPKVSGSSSQIV